MSRLKKYDKPRSEYKKEKADIVFRLLTHHPYFLEQCKEIRKNFKIPLSGYSSRNKIDKKIYSQDMHLELLKNNYKLLNEFNIPHELRKIIFDWVISYILINKKDYLKDINYAINFFAGEHLDDIEIQDDCIYIEVTPYTTMDDIEDVWADIMYQFNKNRENIKYKFGVKKTEFGERLYELTKDGFSLKEAVGIINEEKGRTVHKWVVGSNPFVYSSLNEYKKLLNQLKKI